MKKVLLVVFAFGGIFGTVLSHPKETDFGPELGQTYRILFNDMTLVNNGKFGISRIPNDPFNTHGGFRSSFDTPSQQNLNKLRDQIEAAGFDHDEGILTNISGMVRQVRIDGEPGKLVKSKTAYWEPFSFESKGLFPRVNRSNPSIPANLEKFERTVFTSARNRTYRFKLNGYSVYAEPIRFDHPECLSCHQGSKVGDTAAVFVTAIRRSPSKTVAKD